MKGEKYKKMRLGELLTEKGYIRGPFGSSLKRNDLKDIGTPVYEQQHAIYQRRDFRYFIDKNKLEELKRFLVEPNDIIISCSGTIGRTSIIVSEDPIGIISQALLLLRPNQDIVRTEYLNYFLNTREGQYKLLNASHGSVQVNIAPRDIVENIEVTVPTLKQQDKIINVLSSFDNKIELLKKENNTLENIAQSIFKEWFINTKEKQIEILNLIEFNPQLSIRKKQSASYIEMADLSTNSSSISKIVKRPYTSGSKFQNNDILFARVTPCLENGKTGIVKGLGSEDIGWGSTEFIVMRGKDSITYPFVYCLARNKQFRQFAQKEMIGTSGRQRVPVNKLQGYLIPQPTTKKLDSFNQISLLIFERIEKNSIKAGILIKMKNNLLSKFFKE